MSFHIEFKVPIFEMQLFMQLPILLSIIGPDRLGLGGQGSWADRLGLGGQGSRAGPAWVPPVSPGLGGVRKGVGGAKGPGPGRLVI